MKQKFNELLDKPWTARTYLKSVGIVVVLYTIVMCIMCVKWYWDEIKDWFKKKFIKKKSEEAEKAE